MTLKQFKKRLAKFGEVHSVQSEECIVTYDNGQRISNTKFAGFITVTQSKAKDLHDSEFASGVIEPVLVGSLVFDDFALSGNMYVKVSYIV